MVEILFAKKTDLDVHIADTGDPHSSGLTDAEVKTAYENNADTNEFSDAEQTKLSGIEASATADQTGAQIKTAYEAEANAYTDTKNTKLAGIETAADVTDNANVASALPVSDATLLVGDPGDLTKAVRIDAGAITAATTRVLTMPDRDVDLGQAALLTGANAAIESFTVAVGDELTAITTGTAKITFRMPYAFTLLAGNAGVRASVNTVSSSGIPTVDINEAGATILSTKLTIDASEKTSLTAAAAVVISDTALADDAEITIDIDVAGTGAKGLKVMFRGRQA